MKAEHREDSPEMLVMPEEETPLDSPAFYTAIVSTAVRQTLRAEASRKPSDGLKKARRVLERYLKKPSAGEQETERRTERAKEMVDTARRRKERMQKHGL